MRGITVAVLYTVIGVAPLFLVSAQKPALDGALGLGKEQLSISVSAYFIAAAIASLTLGPLTDRMGPSLGLRISAGLSTAILVGIPFLATNWQTVVAFLALAGLANTIAQLSSNLAVAEAVSRRRQALGFGLKQAAVPVGALLAGLLASSLGINVGWEIPFLVAATLAAAATVFTPSFPGVGGHATRRVFARPPGPLVALAMCGMFGGATGNALAVFVVDAGVTIGFSSARAAVVLSIGSAVSITMRVAAGWLVDRRSSTGFGELGAIFLLGVAGFGLLAVAGGEGVWFVIGVLIGFASAWGFPGVMYFTTVRLGLLPPASATGLVLSGTYLGSIVGPLLAGFIAERASYTQVWTIGTVLMAAGFVSVAAARRLGRSRRDVVVGVT